MTRDRQTKNFVQNSSGRKNLGQDFCPEYLP